MSLPTEAALQVALPPAAAPATLRNLYLVRFAFAIVWAGLLASTATELGALATALLVAYPLFDLGAAVYDLRSSGASPRGPVPGGVRAGLYLNMALSLVAAIGLAVAADSGIPDVLRLWGGWAIAAGAVQLVVAVRRHRLGGQWALILSGGISVLAGAGFVAMAGGDDPALGGLAGYATLGGVFFLISAIRLHRTATRAGAGERRA